MTKAVKGKAMPIDARQKTVALLLALCTVLAGAGPSYSCAPTFPLAVMVNGIHPDFPLKLFAAGRLGIIQPGWAQSYLVVSYRYLSGLPLDKNEQVSIFSLWGHRFAYSDFYVDDVVEDPGQKYFALRAEALGQKLKAGSKRYDFSFSNNVFDDAFANALVNLQNMIKHYGKHSAAVKEWLQAQDKVFGVNEKSTQSEPQPAPANADSLIKLQRSYQIAAARFYLDNFTSAKTMFEEMARSSDCPWKDLAWYMAARCAAMNGLYSNDRKDTEQALAYCRDLIARNWASRYRVALLDLLEIVEEHLKGDDQSVQKLAKEVLIPHSERFGNDVGDLTKYMDQYFGSDEADSAQPPSAASRAQGLVLRQKVDLIDWMATFQQVDGIWTERGGEAAKARAAERRKNAAHALERWRQTRSLPWLVAAVSHNDLLDKHNSDLRAAASKISPQSPAYLTAQFYCIDALIRAHQKSTARKQLSAIMARKDLPPSAANMFRHQKRCTSQSVAQCLQDQFEYAVEEAATANTAQLPNHWYAIESRPNYYKCAPTVADCLLTEDMNTSLPQSYWLTLARNKSLAAPLRARIVRVAWLRAKLLGKECDLDDLLLQFYPGLKKKMAEYKNAAVGPAKDFALANLVLSNYGMSPYLGAGVERHGDKMDEFDYYHANFWIPEDPHPKKVKATAEEEARVWPGEGDDEGTFFLGSDEVKNMLRSYSKPIIRNFLTSSEKKEVEEEQKLIFKNHPSRFFGETIFNWCKTNPGDPRLPWLLYVIVKIPRWCEPDVDSVYTDSGLRMESKYSRQAHLLLHKNYPNDKWTKKAPVWY
jgi:hypothetical protein